MKNRLTCTNSISTVVRVRESEDVDATARKLVQRMEELEQESWRIQSELSSIRIALSVAGIKPGKHKRLPDKHEIDYAIQRAFEDKSLRECCQVILKDHSDEWLSKSQIEYLIVRGGYKFSTKDSKNSVGVTLQRMKDEGKCEVERTRGAHGNRYRWLPEKQDEDERSVHASATNDSRK